MKINMIPKGILDSEKAELYVRITKLVGEKLSYLISREGGWKAKEIYAHLGIPESRQSEYKDYDKYGRRISKKDLIFCLGGGIVTVDELINKCSENEKERDYLRTLRIYDNQDLRDVIKAVEDIGLDPVEILRKALKEYVKKR